MILAVNACYLHNYATVLSEDSLFRMNKGVPTIQQILVCFFLIYANISLEKLQKCKFVRFFT